MGANTPSNTQTAYGAFTPFAQSEAETIFLMKESGTPLQVVQGPVTMNNAVIFQNGTVTFASGITVQGNQGQSAGTFFLDSAANNLAGNGNNQGNATAIINMTSVIQSQNANNNAFVLPSAVAGMDLTIVNNTALAASLFPAANQSVNTAANNASYSLGANNSAFLQCTVTGIWWATQAQQNNVYPLNTPASNLTGNGNNQGNSLALGAAINVIQTCNANNNGFILPSCLAGMQIAVVNNTANVAQVFPQANQSINAAANNTAYQLSPNAVAIFESGVAAQWQATQGYQTGTYGLSQSANALTGNGNNQGNSLALGSIVSVIQTCNANNNGFILPATIAGMQLCVVNNTSNVAQVFPQANQSINAAANNIAYQLSPNSVGFFECGVAAQWQALQGYQAGGTFGLLPYQNNITALGNSGNAQNYTSGVALGGVINTVLVGNANNNSVILAKSVAGMQQTVVNFTTVPIVIFPFANDAINGTAANTGYALANNSTAVAVAAAAGNWWTFHSQG